MQTANPAVGGQRVQHHGSGGELFVIYLINMLLKAITLGIYHFWAKVRVRRYLWSQTSFDGERFEYDGTGGELFMGFLKVVGLYLLLFIVFSVAGMVSSGLQALLFGALYMAFPVLIGAGLYSAQRYRLSRTRLRGVRFGLDGSAWRYGWSMLGYGIITLLTLGLYKPFMDMHLARQMYAATRYGGEHFDFQGQGGDLFKSFLLAWLLTLPTLGLIWFWYLGVSMRYTAEKLSFPGLSFRLDVSGGAFFMLWLTNILLLMFTLGLAFPWVLLRNMHFITRRLAVEGQVNYAAIQQTAAEANTTGEGLVDALDLGAI
ncbi:YjgN family protein [Alkalilimnicola sp. S0819]|uniref:YjgN family protein n=1 Tax=Alkalilimnicola sp. S0819 TaxID=2613922 RepID=UPI00186A2461|nr:YjgN family protein [Alkalilimnicola sp. S0819]